jgi:PDZ domain-containing secreted protein
MSNAELIELLRRNDPQQEATVWVRVHTQAHSVAQVTPFEVDQAGVWISLPETMHVVKRRT